MRPMIPTGDPRSHHRWSIWRPMNSLGFAENISEWNWTYDSPDALMPCVHLYLRLSKTRTSIGSLWPFFNSFHGLSRLLIDGLPRCWTDHPTINHGWSVGRTRILHFPQHSFLVLNKTFTGQSYRTEYYFNIKMKFKQYMHSHHEY